MDILSSVNVIRKDLHQRDIKGRGKVPRNDFICTLLRAGGEMSQVEMLADQFLVDLESGGPASVDYQAFIAHLEDVMREGSRASSSTSTTISTSKRAAPYMPSTSPSNNGGMSLSPDGFDASSVPSPSIPRRGPSIGRGSSFEDVEASCSPATPASPPQIQSTPVHPPPTPRSPDVTVHTLDRDDDLDYVLSPLTPSVVKRAAMRTVTSERLSPSSPFASTRAGGATTSDALLPVTRSITPQYSPDTLATTRTAAAASSYAEEDTYSARPQRRGLAAPPVTMPMQSSPQSSWQSDRGSSASPVPASPYDHTARNKAAIPTDFESALRYARSVSMTSDQDASPPAAPTPPAHHHQPIRRQETMPYPANTHTDPTTSSLETTPRVEEEQVPLRVVFGALVREGREGLLQCRALCMAAVRHRIPVGTEELEALFESVGDQGQGIGFADFCLLVSRLRPDAIRVLRRASLWGVSEAKVPSVYHHAPSPPPPTTTTAQAVTPVSPWNCGVEEVVQLEEEHPATTTTALESVLLEDSIPLPPPPFISRSPPSTSPSAVTREPPLPFEQSQHQQASPPANNTNTTTRRSMPSYMADQDVDRSPSSSPSPPRHHGNFQLPLPNTTKKVAAATPTAATTTISDIRPAANKDRLSSRLYMPTASSRSKTRSGSAPKTTERIRSSSIADRAPAVASAKNSTTSTTSKVSSTVAPPRPLRTAKAPIRASIPRRKTTTTSKSRSLDSSCNCSESEDVDAVHVQLRSSSNGSHTTGRTYVAHREPLPTKASSARSLEPRQASHQRSMSTAASDHRHLSSSVSPQPTATQYTPPAELVAEVCAVVLEDCSRRDKKRQGWVETGFVRKVVAAAVGVAVDSNEYGGPSTGKHRSQILSHCLNPITAHPKGSGGTDYIGFISALVAASKEPTPSPARSNPPPHPAPLEHLSPFTRQLLAAREKMRKVILLELEGLLGIHGSLPILTAMSTHFELHDVRRSGYIDEKILRKSIVQLCHQGAIEVGGASTAPAWLVQRCVKLSREPFDALVGGVSHRQDRDLHAAVSGATHMLESHGLDPNGREAASLCDYRYLLRILGL